MGAHRDFAEAVFEMTRLPHASTCYYTREQLNVFNVICWQTESCECNLKQSLVFHNVTWVHVFPPLGRPKVESTLMLSRPDTLQTTGAAATFAVAAAAAAKLEAEAEPETGAKAKTDSAPEGEAEAEESRQRQKHSSSKQRLQQLQELRSTARAVKTMCSS